MGPVSRCDLSPPSGHLLSLVGFFMFVALVTGAVSNKKIDHVSNQPAPPDLFLSVYWYCSACVCRATRDVVRTQEADEITSCNFVM